MKKILIAAMLAGCIAFSGCSKDSAESIFETAKLEELQDNQEHAKKLYRDIIHNYPDSPYAKKAQDRLSSLESQNRTN